MVFEESAQLSKIKKSKDVLLRKIIPSRVVIDRGHGKRPPLCPTFYHHPSLNLIKNFYRLLQTQVNNAVLIFYNTMRIKNLFTLLLLQRKYLYCLYVIYHKYSVLLGILKCIYFTCIFHILVSRSKRIDRQTTKLKYVYMYIINIHLRQDEMHFIII